MKKPIACMLAVLFASQAGVSANDWPYWRGPEQTGRSRETAVVKQWSLDGDNLLWKVPVGGRSTPVIMGGRLFTIAPSGSDDCLQERIVCMDAETGKILWEHRFNVFHTDIVENRLGWTSIAGDPVSGKIYAHGTGGEFFCFDFDGNLIWKRSLTEELGRSSGYGGRLHSPVIDEDRVIISMVYILSRWGTGPKKAGHRYFALDKRTGEVLWAAQPGGRPLDTTYSAPAVTVADGKRILVAGNADGSVYGMWARTGEPIWSFPLSKRGINPSIVTHGNYAYVTHSEENLSGTKMGAVVCLDITKKGDLSKDGVVWRIDGLAAGYSSPAVANGRLYVTSNSAMLHCFDAKTGKKYWEHKLGRVMKSSPVVTADGVIYAAEVNGRFVILQDKGDSVEELDVTEIPLRDDAVVELNGSPAIVDGRVYFSSSYDLYCLGNKNMESRSGKIAAMQRENSADASAPAVIQIRPAEISLAPGQRQALRVALFDANRLPIGSPNAQWSVKGAKGAFEGGKTFVAATDNVFSAGVIEAKVGNLTATARVRISPSLPIEESFDGMKVGSQPPGWIGVDAKTKLVEKVCSVVFEKLALRPYAKYARMRSYSGPPIPAGYTVEADLMGTPKKGRRPTLSDMGLINSRYKMILLGYEKQLRLVTYSPIPRLQKEVSFDWQPGVWYRSKMSVDVRDGKGYVKAKVWPRDQKEPSSWMVEMIDACPNLEGSPGLYAYSKGTTASKPGASVFFDNYRVYRNDN